ncbi:MAG: methylenetetrahydrofolate reductase [Cyanobacteria bacterium P01_F01_bin.33]
MIASAKSQDRATSHFSVEVTPKSDLADLPRSIREVSVTFLPGAHYREVVFQAQKLRQMGFEPIPHVPARSLHDYQELLDCVTQLRERADIRQVLLIGGSPTEPLGPYASTLDLLETGLFEGLRVGVAGHPEGSPHLDEVECDRVLALKNAYARDTGTEMFVVTQWSLDVEKIAAWLDRIAAFNTLPIYLGIPGPTSPAALLKFARICGVKPSLQGLRDRPWQLGQLAIASTPDYLIDALQDRVDRFHIYSFGSLKRTRDWLEARSPSALAQM